MKILKKKEKNKEKKYKINELAKLIKNKLKKQ